MKRQTRRKRFPSRKKEEWIEIGGGASLFAAEIFCREREGGDQDRETERGHGKERRK